MSLTSSGSHRHFEDVEPVDPQASAEAESRMAVDENGSFEELTLAEALAGLWSAPIQTLRALLAVVRSAPTGGEVAQPPVVVPLPERSTGVETGAPLAEPMRDSRRATRLQELVLLVLRLFAFAVVWRGTSLMTYADVRTEEAALLPALPFIIVGLLLWAGAEVYAGRALPQPVRRSSPPVSPESNLSRIVIAQRLALGVLGIVLIGLTWALNGNNRFTLPGVVAWFGSIVVWVLALAPAGGWRRRDWFNPRPFISVGTLLALIAIIGLGAYFRFYDLPSTPPEMTSDHVEKLLDSQRVVEGETDFFSANNGGGEPVQMYLMAALTRLQGVEMNFTALKLLSAIEGLLTLPLLWWLGREIIGREDRRLGNVVGLALAALVAASYWHTSLSRLGLRIVLTPAVATLLLIYLTRAMRWNRRVDYLKAGLVLGFGLYMYQAVRMLPVVVLVGSGLAMLFQARGLRARRDYLVNLAVLVLISAVVFVPLFRYSVEFPEDFWRRTSGRLLGDSVIETTDEAGNIVRRNASIQERLDAFTANLPVLLDNIRNALLMFNWKGDVAWINAAPNRPALDPVAGALLLVGLPAWGALIWRRRRDMVYWLVPLMVFIMLLPSALSLAYPIENPSATRTSGALPPAYLIAALPLALIARSVRRVAGGGVGMALAVAVVAGLIGVSYSANASVYFNDYRRAYLTASLPYSDAGRALREFASGEGSYGNAFMIAYPYWWDHRAVGIEGGAIDWPNGIISVERVPEFLYHASGRDGPYRFDPTQGLLFFFSPNDDETLDALERWFPDGTLEERQAYQPEDWYRMYRVPPMGEGAFRDWLRDHFQTGN